MKVLGECALELPGLPCVQYTVIKDLPCDAILGADFFHQYGATINFRKNCLKINNTKIPLIPFEQPWNSVDLVSLHQGYEQLLQEFPEVFGSEQRLGKAMGIKMRIETVGSPVKQQAYRLPLVKRESVAKEIERLLAEGIIRPSVSAWSSPIVLVPKKTGGYRLCIDYRKVNSVTVKDGYPLPNIRTIFDSLQGASYFSLLDLYQGYHHILLDKDSIEKTAFSCEFGHYEYVRMPFGLCNAPAVFQRLMNRVLHGLIGKGVFVYLDDICVYAKSRQEHDDILRQVLQRLKDHGLCTKASKCTFGTRTLKLLGHIVDEDGIHTDPEKCEAISKMPPPRTQSEVRRFLGSAGYYRDLIPGYARLVEPLVALTRKDNPYVWSKRCQEAFQAVKDELMSDHCVGFPDVNRPYNLYTDACDYAMGAVLTQEDPETGKEKAIYYISHLFSETQRRWPTIEKEAYAVIYAVTKLRPYLLGSPGVTVYTDHRPLLCLFTGIMDNTKIQRWAIIMAEYNVRVTYIKGEHNLKADFLSRLRHMPPPTHEVGIAVIDSDPRVPYPKAWDATFEDPGLEILRFDDIPAEELRQEQQEELTEEDFADADNITIDGVLCSVLRPAPNEDDRPRIILPSKYQADIIKKAHIATGHGMAKRTLRRVREAYVWKGMVSHIVKALHVCPTCAVHSRTRDKIPMGEGPSPALPDQVIALDLIGPFARDEDDYKFALVIIDHCTNWTEAYPLRYKRAKEVLKVFCRNYLPYHASPNMIITDNGMEFSSDEWRNYMERHDIKHQLTTPYNPKSNGKVERANKSIKEMMGKLSNNQLTRWTDFMPEVVKILNSIPTDATGFSPFFLQTGREPRLPISTNLSIKDPLYTGDRVEFLTQAFHEAYEVQKARRAENKHRIDMKAKAKQLEVGDTVIVLVETKSTHAAKWDHGYKVVRIRGNTVWVTHTEKGGIKVLSRSKVKLVDPLQPWAELAPRPSRYEVRKQTRGRNQPAADLEQEANTDHGPVGDPDQGDRPELHQDPPPAPRRRGRPRKVIRDDVQGPTKGARSVISDTTAQTPEKHASTPPASIQTPQPIPVIPQTPDRRPIVSTSTPVTPTISSPPPVRRLLSPTHSSPATPVIPAHDSTPAQAIPSSAPVPQPTHGYNLRSRQPPVTLAPLVGKGGVGGKKRTLDLKNFKR